MRALVSGYSYGPKELNAILKRGKICGILASMKNWTFWLVIGSLAVFACWWLYVHERHERFRLLVWAKAVMRRDKMLVEAWAAHQKARRAELESKPRGVVLGFQQPALS
jgi:hypothetical protein